MNFRTISLLLIHQGLAGFPFKAWSYFPGRLSLQCHRAQTRCGRPLVSPGPPFREQPREPPGEPREPREGWGFTPSLSSLSFRTIQGEGGDTARPSALRTAGRLTGALDPVWPCHNGYPAVFSPNILLTKPLLSPDKCQLPDPQELPGTLDQLTKLWLPSYVVAFG